MKIIQLITCMEAGGVQRVGSLLKSEFDLRGYDSTIWFLYMKRPAYANVTGIDSLLNHPPSSREYFTILIRLARMIRKEKPDVLISHTYYANVLGHILSTILGVRRRIAVQHNPTRSYPRMARIADSISGSIGLYTHNVVVSKTVAESVSKYSRSYRKRLSIVCNGVPAPSDPAPRNVTRLRWNIPLEARVLVHVGRLCLQKNQEFLIQLLREGKDLHLLLVGDGELREWLYKLSIQLGVSDRVHFTGEVSPDDVPSLISCGDVFALPSIFEAVGLVVLEAMAVGVPVVSNDIPSSREFIEDDGILVDIASPQKWLSTIQTLLDRPEWVPEMLKRAKARVRRFTVARMVNGYEALLMTQDRRIPARWTDIQSNDYGESGAELSREAKQQSDEQIAW
jgi:glycosyltransferase involved in cell wall biosynthesis